MAPLAKLAAGATNAGKKPMEPANLANFAMQYGATRSLLGRDMQYVIVTQ